MSFADHIFNCILALTVYQAWCLCHSLTAGVFSDFIEGHIEVVVKCVEVALHLMFVHYRVHKLHSVDLVENLIVGRAGQESLDCGHGEFGV